MSSPVTNPAAFQAFTADAMLGPIPGVRAQPNDVPVATHAGQAEPMARTERRALELGPLGNPALVLVALLGLAVLVLQFSVRGSVEVRG